MTYVAQRGTISDMPTGTDRSGVNLNGGAVRAIRERSGLSVSALAALARVDRSHLSHIEAGRRRPSPATAQAIAQALRCPLAAILADPNEGAA